MTSLDLLISGPIATVSITLEFHSDYIDAHTVHTNSFTLPSQKEPGDKAKHMNMHMQLYTMALSSFFYAVENSSPYLYLEESAGDDLFHHQNLLEDAAYFPVMAICTIYRLHTYAHVHVHVYKLIFEIKAH